MTIAAEQLSTIDSQRVRDVMSKVPTSVTVVAGQPELTGERAAMIVGSFVFVSLEPCLVGFFVGHESTSWPQLNKATVLGISTLASTQTQFCRKLGKKTADRFDEHFWTQGEFGARWSLDRLHPWNASSKPSLASAITISSLPGYSASA